MPWTPKQVRYLESSGSPLTAAQKNKMNAELHADPSLGHHTKGSRAMEKAPMHRMEVEIHHGPKMEVTGHTVHHHMMPKKGSKSGAFMEETHHSFPFDANGQSSTHGDMMEHMAKHLGIDGDGEAMEKAGEAMEGEGE